MNRRQKFIIILLGIITTCAVCVTVWALVCRRPAPLLAPDYAPMEAEANARPIDTEEKDQEKLKAERGGGAVSMTYQKEVAITISENRAALLFQNPSQSLNDMVLQLVITGSDGTETVVAQSGNIKPGNQVDHLDLEEGAARLSEGVYSGKFRIYYYDPDSGEKAMVNSSVDGVKITVSQ